MLSPGGSGFFSELDDSSIENRTSLRAVLPPGEGRNTWRTPCAPFTRHFRFALLGFPLWAAGLPPPLGLLGLLPRHVGRMETARISAVAADAKLRASAGYSLGNQHDSLALSAGPAPGR